MKVKVSAVASLSSLSNSAEVEFRGLEADGPQIGSNVGVRRTVGSCTIIPRKTHTEYG